jgi:hypothetical protein
VVVRARAERRSPGGEEEVRRLLFAVLSAK